MIRESDLKEFLDLKVFLGADHGQLEIRVLAQIARDPLLIELIRKGTDIHAEVGHVLTGYSLEKIQKDRDTRTAVKGIHFGIIYGLSGNSLYYDMLGKAAAKGEKFGMSKERVFELYDAYFEKFHGVKRFIEKMHKFGEENAFVETLFGFKREIAIAGEEGRDTYWKNQTVNTPIQGTAHQLMLIAMATMELYQETYNRIQEATMEVHDALYIFCKLKYLQEAFKQFMELLEKKVIFIAEKWWPIKWDIPLKAEAKAGFRLGVLLPYDGEPPLDFLNKWCEKNYKFEKSLKEKMSKMREI